MKNYALIVFLFLFYYQTYSQHEIDSKRKLRFPLWTYHDENIDIVGLSLGAFPIGLTENYGTTKTFGTRLDVFPLSFLYLLFSSSELSKDLKSYEKKLLRNVNQQIYGLNLSTGTIDYMDIYGSSVNIFMQYARKSNGVSIAGFANQIERGSGILIAGGANQSFVSNGLVLSVFNNETHFMRGIQIAAQNHILEGGRGLQIGVFNSAKNFKGIQLGLWNENDKRSFPIINW